MSSIPSPQPVLTIAAIALGLDMPAAPPIAPPDPHEAVRDCRRYLANAQRQLAAAQTREERMDAELWVDNAERNLDKWRRVAERVAGV